MWQCLQVLFDRLTGEDGDGAVAGLLFDGESAAGSHDCDEGSDLDVATSTSASAPMRQFRSWALAPTILATKVRTGEASRNVTAWLRAAEPGGFWARSRSGSKLGLRVRQGAQTGRCRHRVDGDNRVVGSGVTRGVHILDAFRYAGRRDRVRGQQTRGCSGHNLGVAGCSQ